ncbi:ABC transporter ATP-binding protein [Nitratireductor sp. ZSWI3]|uniref:ABC transporter ATP-binding protein n=1 Tax=Nitratireductor sp. ZSWI3 TaxID=2966359 RepID=UPI0021502A30|nr:ABC transporter ATP-binding protein [Nitratireductor sp. ZSWI3]MCR4265647.1 ABC transporter ATP-binding protein [Nitratireductor sp. ZSWI3]
MPTDVDQQPGEERAAQGGMALIQVRDVAMQFGGLRAVDGLSLTLHQGEMLGLIGPNGAGKTTLFNLIAGSLKPTAGGIFIDDRDVSHEGADRRIGHGVGRTFQIPRPFAEMTVLENVLTGRQHQAGEHIWMNFLRGGQVAREERQAVEKARALLDFVTLSHLESEPARVLSGGQRKLLELARILMADPRAILLDEPAAGVNPSLLEVIIERIRWLNADGKSVLLIEHNMDMVARLCSRVVVMAAGRYLTEGTPDEVVRDPAVIEAYLGEAA